MKPKSLDARVRFASDGENGPVFVRYNDSLMTWFEFVDMCIGYGLTQEFARDYAMALTLEIL